MKYVVALFLVLIATPALAVDVCVTFTAAEVARIQEAKAIVEAQVQRSLTNQQFAKYLLRQRIVEILTSRKREDEHIAAQEAAQDTIDSYISAVKTDMPDPLPPTTTTTVP